MDQSHKAAGIKLLSLVLALGGLVGIGTVVYMASQLLQQHWIYAVFVVAFMAVFVCSVLTGLRLWRGDPRGWKWGLILFIAQIPVLTVPGMSYEFYTGIAIKVMAGHIEDHFQMGFGTYINAYLDTRITDLNYGINLFAAAAALYLFWKKPKQSQQLAELASDPTAS